MAIKLLAGLVSQTLLWVAMILVADEKSGELQASQF
jgi:hypothetical protein